MTRLVRGSAAGLVALVLGAPLPAQAPPGPEAADTVAGVVLADPHRRLERWDDPEVRAWLKVEDAEARGVLEAVPAHAAILDRIRELSAVDQFSVPLRAGRALIHLVVDGETDERRLIWSDGARERDLELAVPTLSGSTLSSFAVSPDGARLAVEWTDPASGTTELDAPEGLALREAHLFGGRILAHFQEGPRPVLRIHDTDDGRVLHSLEVPFGLIWTDYLPGWSAFSGQPGHGEAYFRSIDLTAPGIYRIDMETGRVGPWRLREIGVDPGAFAVRADAYRSRDGTRVPIVLVSRRDREEVPSPTLVYAYGAYGFTPVPFFNARYLTWVEQEGTLAIPYLRGGGVFGDRWHRAGSGPDKMRTIEDLIAAARWLVETGVADPSSLAVEGQSPGGTVAAASALLEPGLWSAVLLETPVADPVRDQLLSGRRASEFGRVEEPAELEAMLGFSPYRLVRPGIGHPPMLLRTAERDRAVPPWHAAKLLAALRAADAGAGGELLLRIEWDGGHFLAGRERRAREWAADLAFLARHSGWPEG